MAVAQTILLLAGEDPLANVLKPYLEQDGFQVVVNGTDQGDGLDVGQNHPDLLILDYLWLRSGDPAFLGSLRSNWEFPILIIGLENQRNPIVQQWGIKTAELVDRSLQPRVVALYVRAALYRDGKRVPVAKVYQVNGLTLDRERHIVKVNDRYIDLTPTEFDLLSVLVAAPGRAFTRTELLARVLGPEQSGCERTIDAHIKNIRAKIGTQVNGHQFIETIYRAGYQFAPDKKDFPPG